MEDDEELEAAYATAREKLLRHYAERSKHAALMPMLSGEIIDKMLAGQATRRDQQERLVWLMNEGASSVIYQGMCTMIGQNPQERSDIIKDMAGEYSYFRHHSLKEKSFGQGFVKIFKDRNGDPSFYQWSQNFDRYDGNGKERHREHAGYIFRSKSRIYFLGRRRGVVRLSIAGMPEEMMDPYLGITLSMRNSFQGTPFAARFALIHESNKELITQLCDVDYGEDHFKSFFGDEKQWYMG